MTGCTESGATTLQRDLEEALERLGPSVESLVQALSPGEAVSPDTVTGGIKYTIPMRFPDGVGTGNVAAQLFRYRDHLRLDVEIAHNRMFARPDGSPSDRRCFLNDYVASLKIAPSADEVPVDFRREVVSGVNAARDAVQRHNRLQAAPWNQVHVVEGTTPVEEPIEVD
jgi:hypothetical protein